MFVLLRTSFYGGSFFKTDKKNARELGRERGGHMLWFTVVSRPPYVSVLFLPHNFFFDLVMMKLLAS